MGGWKEHLSMSTKSATLIGKPQIVTNSKNHVSSFCVCLHYRAGPESHTKSELKKGL